jgi:uncharacterized protein Yka (UPF0111/DUF47 family)
LKEKTNDHASEITDLTNKHGNRVTDLEQAIEKMKKTMTLDFESCQKNIKQLNEELDDTKSKYNDRLDNCV